MSVSVRSSRLPAHRLPGFGKSFGGCSSRLAFAPEQLIQLLFVVVIAEHVIELDSRLHAIGDALLRAFLANRAVDDLGRTAHRTKCRQRVEHESDPRTAEFLHREERRL